MLEFKEISFVAFILNLYTIYISRSGVILGCLCGWTFRSNIGLGQASIDNKVSGIDKAAFIAGKEDHCVRLLNGLTKAACGEVHFTTEALRLVIAKPVLEKRSALHRQPGEPIA